MTAEIRIIQAGPEDLPVIARLFDAYRVVYRQPSDVPAATAFIQKRFERRDSVVFLARAGEAAAGFVQLYASLSSGSMAPIWLRTDLFVDPAHRGRGVGRALMDRARDFSRASGAIRIELTTERANATAQKLYRACGYARDDVFYKFILTTDTRA